MVNGYNAFDPIERQFSFKHITQWPTTIASQISQSTKHTTTVQLITQLNYESRVRAYFLQQYPNNSLNEEALYEADASEQQIPISECEFMQYGINN